MLKHWGRHCLTNKHGGYYQEFKLGQLLCLRVNCETKWRDGGEQHLNTRASTPPYKTPWIQPVRSSCIDDSLRVDGNLYIAGPAVSPFLSQTPDMGQKLRSKNDHNGYWHQDDK